MSHHAYKLAGVFEWVLGFSYVVVGMTTPAAMLAQASSSIDIGNTQFILIGLGVVAVLAKLIDTCINGYKQYITITSESDHGKFLQCQADRESERKTGAESLLAARAAHASDMDRWKAQYAAMVKDYEDRLQNKRDEAEYLKQMIDASHAVEQQLRQANEALTATLVQQNQAFLSQNQQIAGIADRSVENTKAAIRKIPPATPGADSDMDVQTMSVTSERTNIIVTPDPEVAAHA